MSAQVKPEPGKAVWLGVVHPSRPIIRCGNALAFHVLRDDGMVSAAIHVLPADATAHEVARTLRRGDRVAVRGELRWVERQHGDFWHAVSIVVERTDA